jgi:hypothetical protein
MVFIGGSNLGKIAKAAAEKGLLVVDLTASGWSPKPGNIKKVADVLKNLNLKPCDTIVIDSMANSAYFGTDEKGLPMPPAKSGEDGRYHMMGDLQLAPTAVFKTNLRQIDSLLEQGGGNGHHTCASALLRAELVLRRQRARHKPRQERLL